MSNQIDNDIRKSVKNKSSKRSGNKKVLTKKIVLILIVLLLIVVAVVIIKNRKIKITQDQIAQYNYFLLSENDKIGVIDREGKIVVNPEYEYIQIPNPEKPIFVCLFDYNSSSQTYSSKVLNDKGEELYTNYTNVMAIPNNNTSNTWGYETNILTYKENDKLGIITVNGKKVTKPIYDSIETLSYKDDQLKFSKDGKYGVIDISGNEIIKNDYDSISTDGYYNKGTKYEKAGYIVNVKTNEGYRYGYIDSTGKEILECKYNTIRRLTEIKNDKDAYLMTVENGRYGLYKNMQKVIANEYNSIEYDNTNQVLAIEKVAKYGMYDLYGNMILPIQYDDITFAGTIITAHKDGKLLTFDANGNIKKDCNYTNINPTKSPNYYVSIDLNGNYGVLDSNGNVLVNNEYNYIEYAFDKYFICTKNGKMGIIDYTGNSVIANNYDVIQNITGTNIVQAIYANSNTSEIYNKNMNKVSETKNAHIYIESNYVKILSEDSIEYMDFDGNEKEAKDILKSNNIFAKKENGKWGYVDNAGNIIVDFKYDFALDINEYGYGAIKEGDKWGVVNKDGTVIKEPTYSLEDINPTFIGEYYKQSTSYELDLFTNK